MYAKEIATLFGVSKRHLSGLVQRPLVTFLIELPREW